MPFLTYGKLRATWAQVGSDLAAYQTALTYAPGANQWSGNIVSGTPNTLVDPNIEPSLSSSLEFGLDLKFLQNRASASFTYVDESKINEILSVGVSGASGFTNKLINAGQIDRKVFEIQLEGSPIKTPDFTWNVTFNFAKINSKIVELSEGVDAIAASTPLGSGGTSTGVSFGIGTTWHVVGQEWGQLRGSTISRDGQGRPVLDANGLYIPTDDPVDFGSIMPDFTGGFINNFSYKNFNLAFNIDFQKGGKFYSLSDQWGTYSGLTTRTAALNDLGNPVRDNIADGGGVHVVGVDEGGSSMDTYVPAQDYYHQFYNSGIADPSIFDLTYVKLREINLSYQIPISKLGLSKVFTSASVGVIGRNLWLIYSGAQDFDPSEIASGFGENGQFPSIRSYGFNIKLGF